MANFFPCVVVYYDTDYISDKVILQKKNIFITIAENMKQY